MVVQLTLIRLKSMDIPLKTIWISQCKLYSMRFHCNFHWRIMKIPWKPMKLDQFHHPFFEFHPKIHPKTIQQSNQNHSNYVSKDERFFFSAHLWYILDFSPSSCGLPYGQKECIFYVDEIYTGTSRNIFYLNNMNTIYIYIWIAL